MFRTTAVLAYPLKFIRWFREDIYKNNPAAREAAERAIKDFYDANKTNFESRNIVGATVKGGIHNDQRNPDPKGDHYTVEWCNEKEEFVTKRHVYPLKGK